MNNCLGQKQEDLIISFRGEIEEFRFGSEIKHFYFVDKVGKEIYPALYTNGFKIPPLDTGFYDVCFVFQSKRGVCFPMSSYVISNGGWSFSVYTKPFKNQDHAKKIPKGAKTMYVLGYLTDSIEGRYIVKFNNKRFKP